MDWNNIQDALSELDQQIADSVTPHKAEDAGLDRRCGMIYLGEDFLATRNRRARWTTMADLSTSTLSTFSRWAAGHCTQSRMIASWKL